MAIVGFNFDKMLVEKTNQIEGSVKVTNNVQITDVKEHKLPGSDIKQGIIKFNFEFITEYTNVGKIELLGHLLYTESPEKLKQILDTWKKKKDMDKVLMAYLINAVLVKGNIKALQLSQDANLPPHIRLPTVTPKVNAKNYIG
ncbi:MAG: hypothetical protein PHE43_00265 [Candidatus Nanoarchaeia archaeon]|nr:hypothetical protein [Candidatus Nanoarchaeia archaeon]